MKCKEIEKIIFIYEEASIAERERVTDHIASCASCSTLFAQLRQQHELMNQFFPAPPLEYPDQFTRKVMDQIQKRDPSIHSLTEPLVSLFSLRIVCTFLSVVMLAFFMYELNPEKQVSSSSAAADEEHILNTTAFFLNVKEKKSNSSFSDCVKICQTENESPECKACIERINQKKAL
jgi:hypothetical protein